MFTADEPAPQPSPLDDNGAHGDLGFVEATWTLDVTFVFDGDTGVAEGELCAPLSVTVDRQANASVTFDGATIAVPHDDTWRAVDCGSGANRVVQVYWEPASGPALTLEFAGPQDSPDPPLLDRIVLARTEGAQAVSYYAAAEDQGDCP